ncbi:MAG: hypothetical protein A2075_15240 [Geobacteraceae bacterium GWC2_58_44]|nr:MAG: hypothetical protein A2075_15240 [Geobacteraceae bacterium GWC2_58_44]
MLCRRMFLKSSAFFAATVLGAKSAFAKIIEGDLLERELVNGGLPEGKLSLYNQNIGERLSVTYRNSFGEYCNDALQAINWLFRCHGSNETTSMDLRVIEYLNRLDDGLGGGNEIHIVSGYRSPSYNSRLRSKSKGVAKNSLHMKGMAVDLVIPGVGLDRIRQTALALAAGGVGYYPRSGFVHIDSGAFRSW